ncbi:MAG: Stk1 family PASTA domain-containing Ser/Thr kinase [Clostridia bacterium]|nr:Stk1 family PASTA domain-containing Ser/Thr kinase [Clostridia bacterium]
MNLVGKRLAGRYEIQEEIGKGGMAQVYKAWCNLLNRYVAIKVLKEEFKDDKEFVHRFNVEAQAAARISNPHVVSIYDVGYENGLYYIVMEYVEGITLKEYIAEKGKLSWREAVSYASQICEGLEAAHKNQVIHRDIKPQNIIMAPDGTLKVTDFGIARATNGQATVTMANTAIGTVHYLSPEQARGGYTDARTDIYSMGVVLYEMLTGKLPFTDDSPVAVAIKHIQEAPAPIKEFAPAVPDSVAKVTMKAMAKNPEERYATAGAFVKDLRQVLIDPNGEFSVSDFYGTPKKEDMDTTLQMKKVDDTTIEEYAQKIDQEVEEKKLREINEKRDMRAEKKKEQKVTLLAVLSAVLVVALLWMAFSSLTGGVGLFGGTEKIDIPALLDMELKAAQEQYKDQFSIVRRSETQSDKPVGVILEQTPQAGDKVNKREDIVIYVVVSAGNEVITLNDYVGKHRDEARTALIDAGYQVNIIEKFSDSEEKDKVLAQEPAAGGTVAKGGLVTLYISKGSETAEPTASATASAEPTATATASAEPTATTTATKPPVQTAPNGDGGNGGAPTIGD